MDQNVHFDQELYEEIEDSLSDKQQAVYDIHVAPA